MPATNNSAVVHPWWGKFTFREGEIASWRIGELQLQVRRAPQEWELGFWKEEWTETFQVSPPSPGALSSHQNVHRYFFREPGTGITIEPRLADRPLVWRPLTSLVIAPGEEVTIYLRTPVWITLRTEVCASLLWETSLRRLSDTWIGASTEAGGYAYSAGRECFTSRDLLPHDAAHAVTPIAIHNSASDLLHLERINLPVPYLSLFADDRGALWSEQVKLERQQDDHELALLRIGKGAPHEADGGKRISAARADAETNVVFQAFKRLFL